MAGTDGGDDAANTVLASTTAASGDGHAPEEGALSTDAPETGATATDGRADTTAGTPQPGAAHATRGRAGQIVLREVNPTDDMPDLPPARESSTVTTSLLAAFAARAGGAHTTGSTTAVTGAADGAIADQTSSTTGDDTSDATAATPDDTSDTTAATDEIASDRGALTLAAADTTDAVAEGRAGRFANLPTVPIAAAVGQPADSTPADDAAATSDNGDDPTDREDDGGQASGVSPGDPWTTVAQMTLLCIGVLAVIQTVVLVIVNQFLTQSATGVGRDAAAVLAAHGKVTTVMLPALMGGAIAAVALAVWRIRTGMPPASGDHPPSGRRALGVPVPLWVAGATTIAVLGVVLSGSSTSITAAQRTTIAAITTCVALAAAFLFAPRSLAVPADGDDAPDDDAATDSSASPGPLVGVG